MKASGLNLKKEGYNFSCNIYPAKSHYSFVMKLGRVFPSTKQQAKNFISKGICLDVLNFDDVETIESLLNKYGYIGEYQYTKSKQWVRLVNHCALYEALKKEYSI